MFKIGEEVVCVDDSIWIPPGQTTEALSLDGLTQGEIYHIRWVGYIESAIGKHMLINYDPDTYYVRVNEIIRSVSFSEECPYFSWRFVPLKKEQKSTNIELFKKLTRPKKVKEPI